MQKIGFALLALPYLIPLLLASVKIMELLVRAIALNDYLNYLFLGILIPVLAVTVFDQFNASYAAKNYAEAAGYVIGLGAILYASVTIQRLRDKMKSVATQA